MRRQDLFEQGMDRAVGLLLGSALEGELEVIDDALDLLPVEVLSVVVVKDHPREANIER